MNKPKPNRAQRRAAEREIKRSINVGGSIGISTRYRIIDKDGNDVTEQRIRKHA